MSKLEHSADNHENCLHMKNNKFTVVIVDDEKYCIANITKSLKNCPEVQLLGTALNAREGLRLIIATQPDLLFVDMEMPDKTGLELIQDVQEHIAWDMHIVFYTAYDKYLLDALRTSAFDYLLKPYTDSEFDTIMSRFFKHTLKHYQPELFKSSLAGIFPNNRAFMVATITGFRILKVENIVVFEYDSIKKAWGMQLSDLKSLQLKRGTRADIILKYSPSFVQISHNFIINIEYLSFINNGMCIMLPPFDRLNLKITRTYLHLLQDKFETI